MSEPFATPQATPEATLQTTQPTSEAPSKSTRGVLRLFDSWVARLTAVVGLAAAAYGLYAGLRGGGEIKTPTNLTLVSDVTVIENQYQQYMGQPLTDTATKDTIQSAVNLAKAGQYEESRKLFQQLATSVPVPAVFNNLGTLDAQKGDNNGARQAFQQDISKGGDYPPAIQNLKRLKTIEEPKAVRVSGQESEPNNDFNHANEIAVGDNIAASIADGSDTDYFQFKVVEGPRDIYLASIKNEGTTLKPQIDVYDGNRHRICNNYSDETLAQLDCSFSAQAGSAYYVQVSSRWQTSGPYTLLVKPLKQYDSFEPNDDFTQAKTISVSRTIEANIMDADDRDFYVVKAGGAGDLTATFMNGGTTLKPQIAVYDGNRHQICNNYSDEALAQLDCRFSAEAGSAYYVEIAPRWQTSGAYKLIVK